MPTIVFASSKGGAGKTTACIVLASELARQNADFTLIDADPNQHLAGWGRGVGIANVVTANQDSIFQEIQKAEEKTPFVVVDLEGTANMTMSYAISSADLVVVPCKPSDLDGQEAIKIASFIRQQEKVLNKTITFALLRTQTSAAIHTKIERAIVQDFEDAGSNIFKNRLIDREAFRSVVSYSCFIHDLETNTSQQRKSKDKAIETANAFALEIIDFVSNVSVNSDEMQVLHA